MYLACMTTAVELRGLFRSSFPELSNKPRTQNFLEKLVAAIGSMVSNDAGLSNVCWVDINAAGPGVRGSLTNRFPTVQGALAAAQPSDTIFIGPGTYTENVVLPDKDNLSLVGFSPDNTIIQNVPGTGQSTILGRPAVGAVVYSLRIVNLTVTNGEQIANKYPIELSGSNIVDYLGAQATDQGCVLENVKLVTAAGFFAFFAMRAGLIRIISALATWEGSVEIQNVAFFAMAQTLVRGSFLCNYSPLNPQPFFGRQLTALIDSTVIYNNVNSTGASNFKLDDSSIIEGSFLIPNSQLSFAPPLAAKVQLEGRVLNGATLNMPDAAYTNAHNMSASAVGGRFDGGLVINPLNTVPGSGARLLVDAQQSNITTQSQGSVYAGSNIDLDLSGGVYHQGALLTTGSGGDGTIRRDYHVFGGGAVPLNLAANVNQTYFFAVGANYPSGDYDVLFYQAGALPLSSWSGTVVSKTGTGVTVYQVNTGNLAADVYVAVVGRRQFN